MPYYHIAREIIDSRRHYRSFIACCVFCLSFLASFSLSLSLCGFYLHICAYRYLLFISPHSFHLFLPCAFSLQHFYISTACHLMCISAASLNNSLAKWWWDILNQSIFRAYIVLSFTSFYRWNDITDITSSLHFVFMDATIFTQFG